MVGVVTIGPTRFGQRRSERVSNRGSLEEDSENSISREIELLTTKAVLILEKVCRVNAACFRCDSSTHKACVPCGQIGSNDTLPAKLTEGGDGCCGGQPDQEAVEDVRAHNANNQPKGHAGATTHVCD